jgi:hypothetical protein
MKAKIRGVVMITCFGFVVLGLVVPTTALAAPPWGFECPPGSQHLTKKSKTNGGTHKETESYCQAEDGSKTGPASASFTDYTGVEPSTYTIGRYAKGRRAGAWITRDLAGKIIRSCVYGGGKLKKGDRGCPK